MKYLLTALLIIFFIFNVNAQELKVELQKTTKNIRGQADGPTVLQFYGYHLKEIFRALDPAYSFEIIGEALRDNRYDLMVEGDLTDKRKIIDAINASLKEEGFEVRQSDRHPQIFALKNDGPTECSDDDDEGFIEKQENHLWEGRCIPVNRVMEKLLEWRPELLILPAGEIKVPRVRLEKSTLKNMRQQLSEQGLRLEVDKKVSASQWVIIYQ